jgi:branched-chain amino acid transport system substrate-binding protein
MVLRRWVHDRGLFVPRVALASCLAVLIVTLSACNTLRVPPWTQDTTTKTPRPGAAPPPAKPLPTPQAKPAPSRLATPIPAAPANAVAGSAAVTAVETRRVAPSLVPYLTARQPQPAEKLPATFSRSTPSLSPSVVRIGLLLPLTENRALLGADRLRAAQDMLNAVQLALFDFANEHFEVVIHDTKGTAAGANMIAFSSDRAVAGDGVYTMGFLPEDEVERVVAYALGRGLRRFAALAPDTAYGRAVTAALRDAAEAGGGVIGQIQFYAPDVRDFKATIKNLANYDARRGALVAQRRDLEGRPDDEVARRALQRLERLQTIGELPFDALFLGGGGKRLQEMAAFLPFYDVDPTKIRMLGTRQWDVPGIGAEPALFGGWYAAPPPANRAEFETRYAATYGAKPHRLATIAYDALALAATLARTEGGADFSAAALTQRSGFAGHDGIFRFLPNGTAKRGLAVLEVGRRAGTVVSPAPRTFAVPTY